MASDIVVVEGKMDESRLKSIFGSINIVVTNGFKLPNKTRKLIKDLSKNNRIIVFTDPDWAGNKIRETINNDLKNNCLNAFIDIEKIKKKKKGVAEAEEIDIRNAFKNLISFNENKSLTWNEYLTNEIFVKENRRKITNYFGWNNNMSSKSLFKYLNYSNINIGKILSILEETHD